jgi:hypothetical protein
MLLFNVTMVVYIRIHVKQELQDNLVAVRLLEKMLFVVLIMPLWHVPMVANTVINVLLKRLDKIYQLAKIKLYVHRLKGVFCVLLYMLLFNVMMVVFTQIHAKQVLQDNLVAVRLLEKMYFVPKNMPLYHVPMVANMTINVGLKRQGKI